MGIGLFKVCTFKIYDFKGGTEMRNLNKREKIFVAIIVVLVVGFVYTFSAVPVLAATSYPMTYAELLSAGREQ